MSSKYKISCFAPQYFPILPSIEGLTLSCGNSGLKYQGRDDLLCVRFDVPAVTAAVFTKSSMPSAPVDWCRIQLQTHQLTQRLIINAGNANAFAGKAGVECCYNVAKAFEKHEKIPPHLVFQASTGVIGEALNGDILGQKALETAHESSFEEAAKAIMTTDTFPKGSGKSVTLNGHTFSLSGIAKGSGMIAPNMGTMLAFIFTDVTIAPSILKKIVTEITETSFNAITVDGDTSTSDTFAVFATGASHVNIKTPQEIEFFKSTLQEIATDLALQIVKDGEGLTKFITIDIENAQNDLSARQIGLSIANSPLVKTAIAGEDPNWGRIVAAIGKSGARADRDQTHISIGGYVIAQNGQLVENYNEAPVAAYMKNAEIHIKVSVGVGSGKNTVYTTDLTHDYIKINADYRS